MKTIQLSLESINKPHIRSSDEILQAIQKLISYHKSGLLGGEQMPEDANPSLDKSSKDSFHYFTLPMALNYQRNSYKLWESALLTYNDIQTRFVFMPEKVVCATEEDLRFALTKYKVALQPNRHVAIWRVICETLVNRYQADIRNLFILKEYDICSILEEVQIKNKKGFPYLSGQKIANYWLYVMLQYTTSQLKNRHCLSIAPDTHVIQASIMLGLVEEKDDQNSLRSVVANSWEKILTGSELCPIDVHTPLWLWSRRGFTPNIYSE